MQVPISETIGPLTYILSGIVSKISRSVGQIFAVDRGVPLFNVFILGESLNSGTHKFSLRN